MLGECRSSRDAPARADNATLSVRTERSGAAAKAGHDLEIHVTPGRRRSRSATTPRRRASSSTADATSLRVQKGTGGMKALGDDDKANIHQTIDDEVLKRQDITFRSTEVEHAADGSRLSVEGDLTLAGTTRPIAFDLAIAGDGTLGATAVVTQSHWGMKPYSAPVRGAEGPRRGRGRADAQL